MLKLCCKFTAIVYSVWMFNLAILTVHVHENIEQKLGAGEVTNHQ